MDSEKNKVEKSVLYLVGTPIGNLSDISERALKVLREVDFVAAEDTRNAMRLLSCFGIKKETVSYYEHNKKVSGEKILERLILGESCALITDAGMPAISDPGEDIVKLCAENAIKVSVIPGPCAAVSALALSALSTSRFVFEGFLPMVRSERKKRLEEIQNETKTVILYEAPHKLRATLSDIEEYLGKERRIALCRELTKINEEVLRLTVEEARKLYDDKEPRGEYVIIIEGAKDRPSPRDTAVSLLLSLSAEEHVLHYEKQGMKKMDAIKAAAKDRGMSKSDLYKIINTD